MSHAGQGYPVVTDQVLYQPFHHGRQADVHRICYRFADQGFGIGLISGSIAPRLVTKVLSMAHWDGRVVQFNPVIEDHDNLRRQFPRTGLGQPFLTAAAGA